jgi:branched-chain amino acid transport system ATP-binding protein
MLELHNISRHFGGVVAVDQVSCRFADGEIVGMIGANGAGKTTMLALIAGHVRPTSGDITLNGQSIVGLRPDQIARRGIARTFQIVKPFAGLTVLQNAETAALFGARRQSGPTATATAREALDIVGLANRADDLAGELTLSGQKRLEIARAIATGASLLMLDEVMAGLTPTEVVEACDIIGSLRKDMNLTILLVEHVMSAVMRLAERVIVIHHGVKIAEGPPSDIIRDQRVIEAYLGEEFDDDSSA